MTAVLDVERTYTVPPVLTYEIAAPQVPAATVLHEQVVAVDAMAAEENPFRESDAMLAEWRQSNIDEGWDAKSAAMLPQWDLKEFGPENTMPWYPAIAAKARRRSSTSILESWGFDAKGMRLDAHERYYHKAIRSTREQITAEAPDLPRSVVQEQAERAVAEVTVLQFPDSRLNLAMKPGKAEASANKTDYAKAGPLGRAALRLGATLQLAAYDIKDRFALLSRGKRAAIGFAGVMATAAVCAAGGYAGLLHVASQDQITDIMNHAVGSTNY